MRPFHEHTLKLAIFNLISTWRWMTYFWISIAIHLTFRFFSIQCLLALFNVKKIQRQSRMQIRKKEVLKNRMFTSGKWLHRAHPFWYVMFISTICQCLKTIECGRDVHVRTLIKKNQIIMKSEFFKVFSYLCLSLEQTRNITIWGGAWKERKSKINISWESFSSLFTNNRNAFSFLQPPWRRTSSLTFVIIRMLHGLGNYNEFIIEL